MPLHSTATANALIESILALAACLCHKPCIVKDRYDQHGTITAYKIVLEMAWLNNFTITNKIRSAAQLAQI